MIRHINNEVISGEEHIVKSLGFSHEQESAIRQIYRLQRKFNLPIKKNHKGKRYIDKDDACYFRSAFLIDKSSSAGIRPRHITTQTITKYVRINKSTLSKLLKEHVDTIPISKISAKRGHRLFTQKNLIAHWYFDYLLMKYVQTMDCKYWGYLVNFAREAECGSCGKFLFLVPGVNCRDFSLEDVINENYIENYINKNPKCPVCQEATFPFDCFHKTVNLVTTLESIRSYI